MALQLNEGTYKEFSKDATKHASNIYQMPALIAEGLAPMSANGLMKRRLEVQDKARFSDSVRNDWMDNYFDTGDAVAYHPDGRVRIVLDSYVLGSRGQPAILCRDSIPAISMFETR